MSARAPDTSAAAMVGRMRAAGLLGRHALTMREVAVLALGTVPPAELRTVRAMAAAMGVSKPAVTRASQALEAAGLMKRMADRTDLRSVILTTTSRGDALLASLRAAMAADLADAVGNAMPGWKLAKPVEARESAGGLA